MLRQKVIEIIDIYKLIKSRYFYPYFFFKIKRVSDLTVLSIYQDTIIMYVEVVHNWTASSHVTHD